MVGVGGSNLLMLVLTGDCWQDLCLDVAACFGSKDGDQRQRNTHNHTLRPSGAKWSPNRLISAKDAMDLKRIVWGSG